MSLSALDILRRAAPLFEERGYHGTSMSLLAEACDLAKPGLYHHFRDKETLFLALLEEGLVALEVELERLELGGNTLGRVAFLTEIVTVLISPPESARVAMRLAEQDLAHISGEARDRFAHAYRRRFPERLGELLVRTGLRPGVDPALASTALLGIAAAFHRRKGPHPSVAASSIADLFAHGVLGA